MITTFVCVGTIGITAGVLGVFALLRGYSLLGDAVAHAALPGIAGAFLLTHTTSPTLLLCGGALAGCIGSLLVYVVTQLTTIKQDAILGIVLSVFFGFGLVLLTIIQKCALSHQSVLNKFLFGSVATLLHEDMYVIGVVSCVVLILVSMFWKEFKLLIFDRSYAHVLGYRPALLEFLLTILCVCAIVIGLQTIGVILMSTLFIAPAAAARQWTNNLVVMTFVAAAFGATSSIIGAVLSSMISKLPAGPIIVVVISGVVLISLLCAPARGILWHYWHVAKK